MLVYVDVYNPLGLHVLEGGGTSTLFTALHEWRKSTMARWIKRKTNERKETRINQRSPPRGSTGWRHRFNCDLLRRHGRAQGHVEPLPHLSENRRRAN